MSDYVRTKAIMYPLGSNAEEEAFYKTLGVGDRWDLEDEYPELFGRGKPPYFEIEVMADDNWDCTYYLSYVLSYTYGADCGEFGRNRFLTPAEQEKYKKIFEQVIKDIDTSKLKYVDYCYYNACESPDFYNSHDDFNDEV